jgi:hypothetical protein
MMARLDPDFNDLGQDPMQAGRRCGNGCRSGFSRDIEAPNK